VPSDPAPTTHDEWRPAVGDIVCTCGYEHLRVLELNPEDDDVEVVVEGGGSYSLRHCGIEPVPHVEWEHYPSLSAVLSSQYSTAAWPEPIALMYREAHDAALNGVYANTKSLCRQALRAALASPEATDSRLTDLITEGVAQGKLPVGIQEWSIEIDLIRSEGLRYEDHFTIRDYDASDALLFTRSCLQILHGASARG
jgi:hypothetical protein